MSKQPERRGLGRGLSALMADIGVSVADPNADDSPAARKPDTFLPIESIAPNPNQPRRVFSEDALADLAESIRLKGVLQPLIVRPVGTGYEIVAGERRWRAAQLARLHEVPVIIRDYDDAEVLEVAIIENIQRSDLNPLEEAAAYRQLMDRFGHTQEKLAEAMSKSRSHIANLLRLLNLPQDVQALVRDGQLTAGHARALITAEQPSTLAQQVIQKGLSVRETESLAKKAAGGPRRIPSVRQTGEKDADTRALEADLSAHLGMRVIIDHGSAGEGGVISVRYVSLDELDQICRALSVIPRDGTR